MAFLSFVVNAALKGEEAKLKEFTLAVEVFDKDASFDPGTDSIVRVEASRLRARLREYYGEEGFSDPVRLEIPKGSYAPAISFASGPGVSGEPLILPRPWVAVTAVVMVLGALYLWPGILQREPGPTVISKQMGQAPKVAILPLRDLSATPDLYFSSAVTDRLISALANDKTLQVTAISSVMKFNEPGSSVAEIGRLLDVEHVVKGTVLRDGERVLITVELVNVDSGNIIWSIQSDRLMVELPAARFEIANAIAAQLTDGARAAQSLGIKTPNPAAYEAYMKGRYFYNQFTSDGYLRSMTHFQEAIEIEPDYAEAYAGLASCHCLLAGHGLEIVSPDVAIPQAQTYAQKALSLDSELAEPLAFLGIIAFKFSWNLESALTQIEHAIRLKPNLYQAYVWHSQILEAMGQHDRAVEQARRAKQLNPLSLAASSNLGWQLYQSGKYIEANKEIDGLIEFSPRFWGAHWVKGNIHLRHRVHARAIEEFRQAVDLGGGHSLPMSALGHVYAISGRHDEARKILAELQSLSKQAYVSPFHIAIIHAGLNEPDLMFEWLDRAHQVKARSLAWLQVNQELRPFHDDPRFRELLERIGMFSI